MRTNKLYVAIRSATGAALLAALLAGCAKPAPPPEPPAPSTPVLPDAPPAQTPPSETMPAPDAAPAAPVQPAPEAPPPTEPSAAPKPTAAAEPSFDSMSVATPSAKLSVAVDLRYRFDSAPAPNQPVTLHLAAVPRVAGTNLSVRLKQVSGVQLGLGPTTLQKTNGTGVYRKQISVTPSATMPAELRVLVTMDVGESSGFGFFSVPLNGGASAQKQDSVKQR